MLMSMFPAVNRNKTKVPVLLALFLKSSSMHWSSRSRPSLHNYYLRKRRKWPLPRSPYQTKWHQTFAHQLAMRSLLKESSRMTSKIHLLSALVHSFATYRCDPSPKAYHFIIKILTKNPSTRDWDQIPGILDHLEKVATFETPECILIDLINSYGCCNMTRHAVDLFFRIPNFRCNPSVDSLNALLSVLCKQKCGDGLAIVPQILMKTQMMNIRLENSTFDVLIRGLCRFGRVNYAVELLHYAVSDGFSLDGRTFSLILATMCDGKPGHGTADILRFFEDLKKLSFIPDKADWCNVIRFLVNKGNAMEAMAVLKQMKNEGMEPDIVCCNWVLHELILEEEYLKADELFDQMLVWGLVPDIFTYNAHISGLCKQNNLQQAIKMLACMEELGCRPDLTTYNTILGACYRNGDLLLARSVISKMEMEEVKLNLQAYECMIEGCCSTNQIDEVRGLLRKMVDKFSAAQYSAFDQILCSLCQRGLFDQALELLQEMVVCKNMTLGRRAWEALVQIYAKPYISELDSTLADSASSHQVDT